MTKNFNKNIANNISTKHQPADTINNNTHSRLNQTTQQNKTKVILKEPQILNESTDIAKE